MATITSIIVGPDAPGNNPPVLPQATIEVVDTFDPLTADGETNLYEETSTSNQAIWGDYHIRSHYEKDGHIYMMGVTSPLGDVSGDRAAFVQLALPTLLLVVDWTACKTAEQPEIPSTLMLAALIGGGGSSPINWILLDEHYEPAMLVATPGSEVGPNPVYRISGTYVYGCRKPNLLTLNDLAFPRPPWMPDTSVDRSVPAAKATTGLFTTPATAVGAGS